VLIYDGDCGFCTLTANWLEERLRTPVAVVPWQEIHDLSDLELGAEDVSTAVYWVDIYGRRFRGHGAFARMLLRCRQPWPAFGVLLSIPPVSWLGAAAYGVIARNRHRLPGITAAGGIPRPVAFQAPAAGR
jgi:predicted DCC family thiol-disulfide oxidoreductase YuxK